MFAQGGQLIGEEQIRRIETIQLNAHALYLKELSRLLERFRLPVGKEFHRLCAVDLFIHTGNIDTAL